MNDRPTGSPPQGVPHVGVQAVQDILEGDELLFWEYGPTYEISKQIGIQIAGRKSLPHPHPLFDMDFDESLCAKADASYVFEESDLGQALHSRVLEAEDDFVSRFINDNGRRPTRGECVELTKSQICELERERWGRGIGGRGRERERD